jgi:hypothetical protein
MIKEGPPGGGQVDAVHAAAHVPELNSGACNHPCRCTRNNEIAGTYVTSISTMNITK